MIILTFITAPLLGQQEVFSCEYNGLMYERINISTIPNRENDFFIFSIITDRSVKRYYSGKDKDIALLDQHIPIVANDAAFMYHSVVDEDLLTSYRRLFFAAGIYRDKKIIEIFRNKVNSDMYLFETDLVTGKTTITDTLECKRNEMIISCIDMNQELNMVTFIDNSNTINIYRKLKGGKMKKTTLEIEVPGEDNSNITNITKKHFGIYDNNQRYHVLFTSPRDKAFIQKDRLILTFTTKKADVYTAIINRNNPGYTIKKFSPPEEPGGKVKDRAAYFVDSFLITCYATEKKLGVHIFNLDSGQLMLSKTIDENNIDQFWTEPIQRTGSFTSKSDIKGSQFDKFYTTIKNNDLSVSGYIDKGKLFLSFGSEYKQVINGTNLLNLFTSLAGTYFINASGDYYGYFISGFQGVKNSTYTSFDATLTLPGFKQDLTSPNLTVWERLSSFATVKRLAPTEANYFYMNNYYYLGYFESSSRKFVFYRFNEKGVE